MLKSLIIFGAIVSSFSKIINCSSSNSKFHIQSLSFSPEIPIRNENVTITMIYDAPIIIDSGKVDYSVSLNGIPIYSETDELCTQTNCPISIGIHNETSEFTWPDVSGKIVSKTIWKDSSGSELLCFQTSSTNSINSKKTSNLRGSNNQIKQINKEKSYSTSLVPYYNQTIKELIHYHNEL